LAIPYEIWIVAESYISSERYVDSDRILVVPHDFKSVGKYKVRALHFSSLIRKNLGLISSDTKVLFLDDDTLPTKKYIEKCFVGNYDIMEGIIQPRLNYGTRYSYVENMRTLACMSVCSIYQSHGHPIWVHGEGICVKASAEQIVGWNFNLIASEDLVFGHISAAKKLKWGFIWEPIYITSPWTFQDFFRQRKRWLWGNVHAIIRILPWKSKIRVVWFYLVGSSILLLSVLGITLDVTGRLHFSLVERILLFSSLFLWLAIYGYIGYTVGNRKIIHVILSMLLSWYTSFMNTFPIWIGLFFDKPLKFEVIGKESSIRNEAKIEYSRLFLRLIRSHEAVIGVIAVTTCFMASFSLFIRDPYSLVYYGDAVSHLVISRAIIDSIHPGILQIGSVYMPMAHLLLLPFVANNFLYYSGMAGTVVSSLSIAVTAVFLFRLAKRQFHNSTIAGILASSLLLLNPSVLYMGIVPMTEAPFMMFLVLSIYFLHRWYHLIFMNRIENEYRSIASSEVFESHPGQTPSDSQTHMALIKCGLCISAASLTRYEGWSLPLALVVILFIAILIGGRKPWSTKVRSMLIFLIPPSLIGIGIWLIYNLIYFKDIMYFLTNPYSIPVRTATRSFGEYLRGHPGISFLILGDIVKAMYGLPTVVISIVGFGSYILLNLASRYIIASYLLVVISLTVPFIFDLAAMNAGFGEIYPASTGGWISSRYLVLIAPLIAFCSTSAFISSVIVIRKLNYRKTLRTSLPNFVSIVVIVIVGLAYISNFVVQPLEAGKTTAMSDSYTMLPYLDRYKYSFDAGKALGELYNNDGRIVMFTPSQNGQQIMLASDIPLKNFIYTTSGKYWITSKTIPWKYGDYLIIRKPIDIHPDPLNDLINHWRTNESVLHRYYTPLYENPYYAILKKTQ
jgi:hypothetical protein